jgi:hypothetical protein
VEMLKTAANDTAVNSQRFHVMRVASARVAGESVGTPIVNHRCESPGWDNLRQRRNTGSEQCPMDRIQRK